MGETMSREQAAAKLAAMMAARLSVHPTMPRSEATRVALSGVTEKAIELIQETDALRAQLTEKDREIERLKTEVEARISATGARCDQIRRAIGAVNCLAWDLVVERVADLQAQLSASQARERELEAQGVIDRDEQGRLREEIRVLTESKKFATDEACRFSSLYFESQAREREAVEMAEETEVSKKEFMSALAAARKALADLFAAPLDPNRCDSTSYPWWFILDPKALTARAMSAYDAMNSIGCSAVTGPFFSREAATEFLNRTRYNFGKNAVVWCASGCYSQDYRKLLKLADEFSAALKGDSHAEAI